MIRLAEDIRLRGLLQPIVVHEGAVLDGGNRLEACQRAGVRPRFEQWRGEGSPLEWAVAQNVLRRHLSPSQRAVLALELLPLLEEEAPSRQRLSAAEADGTEASGAQICATVPQGGKAAEAKGAEAAGAQICATSPQGGKAAAAAARLVGASPRYVETAKQIRRQCPDLLPLVSEGTINLHQAEQIARLPPMTRDIAVEILDETPPGEEIDVRRLTQRASTRLGGSSNYFFPPPRPNPRNTPPLPTPSMLLLPAAHHYQVTLTPGDLAALDQGAEVPLTVAHRACVLRRHTAANAVCSDENLPNSAGS